MTRNPRWVGGPENQSVGIEEDKILVSTVLEMLIPRGTSDRVTGHIAQPRIPGLPNMKL
jgi:hypothetical protein